jgi:hypothetical protein
MLMNKKTTHIILYTDLQGRTERRGWELEIEEKSKKRGRETEKLLKHKWKAPTGKKKSCTVHDKGIE